MVAGISAEYYTQLERGNVGGVSEDVLEAVVRTLQLDDVERAHLFHLVRAAKQLPVKANKTRIQVRPGVQRVLDSMTDAVAFVRNSRQDVLSANRLGYALYADLFANPQRPANLARFVFPRPPRPRLLRRLGRHRGCRRVQPARHRRARPLRPGAHRPRRRTLHAQ
jgi:hypothetical protein